MSSDNLTTVERRAPPSQAAVADSCSVGTGSTLVAGLTARRESQVGAAHACALRTLRKRNQPQAPPDAPADPSLLPEAPRKTLIHVGVGGTLAELEWKPSDGLPASSFLSEWRSRDWLASTTLPVILTLFWIPAEERWLACTLAMADDALASAGHGIQLGLFAARPHVKREVVTRYDGELLGVCVEESQAYKRMVARALRRAQHSYLCVTDGPRKDTVCLYDGAVGRAGGARCANSARGLSSADGRSLVNNCKIDTEGDLVMTRNVPALSPFVPAHHAAILVDYGEAYWDWSPAIVGS